MKNAVIYTRVSTRDQKEHGNSLKDQETRLRDYADQRGYTVLKHFQDDASGTTFDRPAFKELLEFLKKNKGNVNYLLFMKWDRFSRNSSESMGMVNFLLDQDVKPIAIEQELDFSIPENLLISAIYQILPHIENIRRNRNTKTGMRRGSKDGYWMNNAPIGYKNAKDEFGKPILVHGEKATLIEQAFYLVAHSHLPILEVLRTLRKRGLTISKSQFFRLLRNPVYKGYIIIPAWETEQAEQVRGRFMPIVDERLFGLVQRRLSQKGRKQRVSLERQTAYPLRGVLRCEVCGCLMTSSQSRSKTTRLYSYYHCQSPCKCRVAVADAHGWVNSQLRDMTMPPEIIRLYRKIAEDVFKKAHLDFKSDIDRFEKDRYRLTEKRKNALSLYAEGKINHDEYEILRKDCEDGLSEVDANLANVQQPVTQFKQYLSEGLSLLENLVDRYEHAPVDVQRKLLSSIYPENIVLTGKNYRTPRINEAITIITKKVNELGGIVNGKNPQEQDFSHTVARTGIEPVSPP